MIIIFDTETTGLPESRHNWELDYDKFPHICQIAWIICDDNGNILLKENHMIKPDGWKIPEEATAIHGITQKQAMEEGERGPIVLMNFLRDATLCEKVVGHNIYFDVSMVKANVLDMKSKKLYMGYGEKVWEDKLLKEEMCKTLDKDKRHDTMRMSAKYLGYGRYIKLIKAHEELFGENFDNAHDAMGDVMATKKVYFELLNKI